MLFQVASRRRSDDDLIVEFPKIPRESSCREKVVKEEMLISSQYNHSQSNQVSFSPNSILHRYSNPKVHEQDTWLSKDEYRALRRHVKADVSAVRNDKYTNKDDDDIEILGISHLICAQTLKEILKNQKMHVIAVMKEQARQLELGVYDIEYLREVSEVHSMASKVNASVNGLSVAAECNASRERGIKRGRAALAA